jgi:hypothetical protein
MAELVGQIWSSSPRGPAIFPSSANSLCRIRQKRTMRIPEDLPVPYDVFISYSSPDKTVADAACARLESAGIRCWIAPRDVVAGRPYGEAIIDAIHEAKVMVLVFSSNANLSDHIPKEVERAVSNGVAILPFRIQDVAPGKSLDYFIGSVHWLDAMTPPMEKHLDNLAATVQKLLPTTIGARRASPAQPTVMWQRGEPGAASTDARQTASAASSSAAVGSAAVAGERGANPHRADMIRKRIYVGIGAAVLIALVLVGFFEWVKPTPPNVSQTGSSSGTYDIPSLQASVAGPLLFFLTDPNRPVPPLGQRTYANNFRSALTSGKQIFWQLSLNFQGQFPPPDYQIESVWYRDSKEVFRGTGNYKGSDVSTRAFHNRFGWVPPGGHLDAGQYQVDLFVAGQQITSGTFAVQ